MKKLKAKAIDKSTSVADFSYLLTAAPPIIWRAQWNILAERLGLPFRRGTLQNLDSQGRGPRKVTHARRVGYRREDVVEWLGRQANWK